MDVMQYKKIKFQLIFEKQVHFTVYPVFILRSVLGKSLRYFCCLFKGTACEQCSLNNTCAYSYFFETHIPKNTHILKGRNKASHPFVMHTNQNINSVADNLLLETTFIGNGIQYIPYFYFALQRAGNFGLFKSRTRFSVTDVLQNNTSLINKEGCIDNSLEPQEISLEQYSKEKHPASFSIEFTSPSRLKSRGKLISKPSFSDIINAVTRRYTILNELHTNNNHELSLYDNEYSKDVSCTEINIDWLDLAYFSGRQKERLKLGGITGILRFSGNISDYEIGLLKTGELFHIGKNTAFGLGKISVTKEELLNG